MSRRPEALDAFCGEGGTGKGLHLAGFDVFGIDKSAARLKHYPFESELVEDAVSWIAEHGHKFDLIVAGPTCTGYSRGTVAIPDRLAKYDRQIPATREALEMTGRPYVIENVEGAARLGEIRPDLTLCGSEFNLTATDDDGTPLWLRRHRVFESNVFLMGAGGCRHPANMQCAGAYGGARRDKWEAKHIRRGGYVPNGDVQRALLGTPWMTDTGAKLCIPPVFAQFIGEQLLDQITRQDDVA